MFKNVDAQRVDLGNQKKLDIITGLEKKADILNKNRNK
jgi:hypothetical protein